MMATTLTFLGNDMVALGLLAGYPQEAVTVKDGLVDPVSTVTLSNGKGIFSQNLATSIVRGIEVIGERVTMEQDGITLLDGYVQSAYVKKNTYTLELQSALSPFLSAPVFYVALDTDPATAAKEILEYYAMEDKIDYPSFNGAAQYYADNNVSVSVIYNLSQKVRVADAISALAEAGVARVWMQDDKIYFRQHRIYTEGAAQTITDSTCVTLPEGSKPNISAVYNDYRLGYRLDGDNFAQDGGIGEVTQPKYKRRVWEEDYGDGNAISYNDYTTAKFFGDLRMYRDRYAKREVTLSVKTATVPLYLDEVYLLDLDSLGLSSAPFRLISIKRNQRIATCVFSEEL